jgi:hypothetical protein
MRLENRKIHGKGKNMDFNDDAAVSGMMAPYWSKAVENLRSDCYDYYRRLTWVDCPNIMANRTSEYGVLGKSLDFKRHVDPYFNSYPDLYYQQQQQQPQNREPKYKSPYISNDKLRNDLDVTRRGKRDTLVKNDGIMQSITSDMRRKTPYTTDSLSLQRKFTNTLKSGKK